jgi:hypothetical protein
MKATTSTKLSFVAMAVWTLSSLAFADDISLGNPVYGGTGCPQGSASALLSPDSKTLTVLFDQYQVEAGRSSGKSFDRSSCNLAIPVHVPQGFSVSILQVDYRGTNILPSGGSSRLTAEYFFAGSKGPTLTKSFRGPLNQDYDFGNTLMASAIVWSECGADVNLRANTSVLVMTNRAMEDALTTVDTADVKAAIIYKLQWRRCGG